MGTCQVNATRSTTRVKIEAGGDGQVPSDSTLYRTFFQVSGVLDGLWEAVAEIRQEVWRRANVTAGGGPVVLDIDATLVEIHSCIATIEGQQLDYEAIGCIRRAPLGSRNPVIAPGSTSNDRSSTAVARPYLFVR